jgi:hypothetical protein
VTAPDPILVAKIDSVTTLVDSILESTMALYHREQTLVLDTLASRPSKMSKLEKCKHAHIVIMRYKKLGHTEKDLHTVTVPVLVD